MKRIIILAVFFVASQSACAQTSKAVFPGANELTPSKSVYFDWLNSEWPGSNERKTLANLDFFKWLHDEYGMELDIYFLDAGNLDVHGRMFTTLDSKRFKDKFPNGLEALYEKAKSFGCRLGFWLGPDGYGNTPEQAKKRTDLLVGLCKTYNFALFKFDAACSGLNPKNEKHFINTMTLCRKYCPDLITLNHRINVSDEAKKHMTTWLWEGQETYIDVHMKNEVTAPHHRAFAIARGLVPRLQRLTEDCGVCISSCLDYWEDDLIIQAFNRNLICAPEIYGNPWLLNDEEFPKLARIFNLHKKYNDILVRGIVLPQDRYGPRAVSRGNRMTRLITLRNVSWTPVKYVVELDEVGLEGGKEVTVVQYHPTERYLGHFSSGSKVEVEVLPFRACLLMASTNKLSEVVISGCDYEIVQDVAHRPVRVKLLGYPGKKYKVKLEGDYAKFSKAKIGEKTVGKLIDGKAVKVKFSGKAFDKPYHRKIGVMNECAVPEEAEALYEATCFAADSNPLEVRSLIRSGETSVPQVKKARDAFFNHPDFVGKEIWDKYAFDGNRSRPYSIRNLKDPRIDDVALRLDLGKVTDLDTLLIDVMQKDKLQSFAEDTFSVEASSDLTEWKAVATVRKDKSRLIVSRLQVRYLRIFPVPLHISEITGFKDGENINKEEWRASNLFNLYGDKFKALKAWSCSFKLEEIPKGSYLCIAVNGRHGVEGAYAAVKVGDEYIGAPDRSPSFPVNAWERIVWESDRNYTYYIPLAKEMINKEIEAYVLGFDKDNLDLEPEIWVTAYPIPFEEKMLTLYR